MKRHDKESERLIQSHEGQMDDKKESIKKLVEEKDLNIGTIHHLVVQQLEVSKDQIQTNKELREVIQLFIKTVSNKL